MYPVTTQIHQPGRSVDIRRRAGHPLVIVGTLLMLALVAVASLALGAPADAATKKAVQQCNSVPNSGGLEETCTVTVTNNLNVATGVGSSVVVLTSCQGAAGAAGKCTTTRTPSTSLATSVTQCNGSENGGGSTVRCTVRIVNNIVGVSRTSPATINQCHPAGTGGGTQPTTQCTPAASRTTNADITQCNQSGNGGGARGRVRCTVTTSTVTSALPVTINQCIGSGNGGGATVICSAQIVNRVVSATPSSSSAPTSTSPTSPATSSGTAKPSTGHSSPNTGSTSTRSSSRRPTSTSTSSFLSGGAGNGNGNGNGSGSGNASGSGSTSTHTAASLASTGTNSRGFVAIAALLLGGGVLMLLLGRRPKGSGTHR